MKSDPLAGFLVLVLVACAIYTAVWGGVYIYSNKKTAFYERKIEAIENTRLAVQTLANEAIYYSQQHPTIDPLLQKFELKQKATNSPLTAPPPAPSKAK